jgi:uncharacterized protein
MQVLRWADYEQVPWKNGGGVTREVFVQRCNDREILWDWRISMADVTKAGPFSLFPGIDRTISVLEGQGIKLSLPQNQLVVLNKTTEPFAFVGEWEVSCDIVDGPTMDLNILTRRTAFRHHVQRKSFEATLSMTLEPGWNALVANTPVTLCCRKYRFDLARLDTAIAIGPDVEITPVETGDVYFINVQAT